MPTSGNDQEQHSKQHIHVATFDRTKDQWVCEDCGENVKRPGYRPDKA